MCQFTASHPQILSVAHQEHAIETSLFLNVIPNTLSCLILYLLRVFPSPGESFNVKSQFYDPRQHDQYNALVIVLTGF